MVLLVLKIRSTVKSELGRGRHRYSYNAGSAGIVDGIGFRDIFLRNVKFFSVCCSMEHSSQEGATRTGFDPLRHVVCSMHTPRSEAQPKTATRIHLPIHLGSTLMKKIGGSPLSRAQGRVQRVRPDLCFEDPPPLGIVCVPN